ncbi:MAG TPA: ABC transporter permease [Oxalobacteraceae bacterium]|nr:ABC transporter permease [Oxalobacteraceae bacterium]
MTLSSFLVQLLNGLAGASTLFLVAAGLSLIFGVTRVVNFAHGSLYMLGLYIAYSIIHFLGSSGLDFWSGVLLAAVVTGILGAIIEIVLLRRIYRAPELFQLLATFALVLVIKDAALYIWGAEDMLGPRAPGLTGAVRILGHEFPQYNLVLICIGPVVLALLWLLLTRTRWGTLIRAATQDREMVGALGVNQAWLFTSVFALGAFLAGLGGAVQIPNEPANLTLDLQTIGDAFVVVVVGGMGSIPGAYLAALIIAETKAICASIGTIHLFGIMFSFSKLTLVVEFLIMAVVLVVRPWGLLGRPQAISRNVTEIEMPLRPASGLLKKLTWVTLAILLLLPLLNTSYPYALVLAIDLLVAVLFATSLHFIMGPAGMHSFGHAAYFCLGAYGAALFFKALAMPMELSLVLAPLVAGLGALLFGWFCVRLSGVYLAMLTLAFSQIVWSIAYQWEEVTGGSNGLFGIWPAPWLADKSAYYYLTLAFTVAGVLLMRRILFSPFGYAMRAGRDSFLRSDAIGIDVKRMQWIAFVLAGLFCGMAGALYSFSKGSISPETMSISHSVDGLVMVLLGGLQTLAGPIVGSVVFTWLHDVLAQQTEYWRALLGVTILILVLAFPQGIVGFIRSRFEKEESRA